MDPQTATLALLAEGDALEDVLLGMEPSIMVTQAPRKVTQSSRSGSGRIRTCLQRPRGR